MSLRLERVVARLLLVALCLFGAGTTVRAAAEPVEIVRVEARRSPGRSAQVTRRCDERRASEPAANLRLLDGRLAAAPSRLEPPGRRPPPGARLGLFLRDRALLI
jgi:hypothetical protein